MQTVLPSAWSPSLLPPPCPVGKAARIRDNSRCPEDPQYERFSLRLTEVSRVTTLLNRTLLGVWPEIDDPPADGGEVDCHKWLGGVLKHYERKAA